MLYLTAVSEKTGGRTGKDEETGMSRSTDVRVGEKSAHGGGG